MHLYLYIKEYSPSNETEGFTICIFNIFEFHEIHLIGRLAVFWVMQMFDNEHYLDGQSHMKRCS